MHGLELGTRGPRPALTNLGVPAYLKPPQTNRWAVEVERKGRANSKDGARVTTDSPAANQLLWREAVATAHGAKDGPRSRKTNAVGACSLPAMVNLPAGGSPDTGCYSPRPRGDA